MGSEVDKKMQIIVECTKCKTEQAKAYCLEPGQ